MKVYVFYTNPIIEWVKLLKQSSEKIENLEIVPILGDTSSTRDLAGATSSQDYMKLMLSRWLKLPDIIRDNIGTNILFIDADMVFNHHKKDFIKNIDSFLEDQDLVTQYDTNSGMSVSVNMGFLGIKCNEKNLNLFLEFMDIISKIQNPQTGYPQIEFNDFLKNYDKKEPIKFKTLPKDYGYLTANCYFFHAIGCSGNQNKINAMKSALNTFEERNRIFSIQGREDKKIALIVNTISKNKDVWEMFFSQMKKHAPDTLFDKKYIFVDEGAPNPAPDYETCHYSTQDVYQQQFAACIEKVTQEYCVYISEDYILYDDVREDLVENYKKVLDQNPYLSFIRFMRGGVVDVNSPRFFGHEDLYQMHHSFPYFYTNQAALWRTRDLEKIHKKGPALHIGNEDWQNSFEYQATETCKLLDIQGLYSYHGEPKRGQYHYDSIVFPHISTALVKGKWNMSEYPAALGTLIKEYDILTEERGTV